MPLGKLPARLAEWLDGQPQFSLGSPVAGRAKSVLLGSRLNDVGRRHTVASQSADFTIDLEAGRYLVDASGGPVTVTLPRLGVLAPEYAEGLDGAVWTVKKIDATSNQVIIQPYSGELIDGLSTWATSTPYASRDLVAFNGAWYFV